MAKKKEGILQDIPLLQISPSKNNTRKNFDEMAHKELVASIKSVGLLQPIVIRPFKGDTPHEIVFGERRYRAVREIAEESGALETATIKAIIRSMDDNDAFIARVVENLQRQDISEQEEAAAFANFVEKYGENAIAVLSEKIGATQVYVRKRIAVMQLPRPILKAWKRGVVSYGHLEQFLRIEEKRDQIETLSWIYMELSRGKHVTIADLKNKINGWTLPLDKALFDTSKCMGCVSNSATQRSMFAVGADGEKCQKQKCFIQKQVAFFTANWKTMEQNAHKTNSFVVAGLPESSKAIYMYGQIPDRCIECPSYASIIHISGDLLSYGTRVCIGESGCYTVLTKKTDKADSEGGSTKKEDQDKPRVAWHGEFFRQEFYKTQIPAKIGSLPPDHNKRIALAALLFANEPARTFARTTFMPDTQVGCFYSLSQIIEELKQFGSDMLDKIMRESLQHLIFADRAFGDLDRRTLADHLGVDLNDWTITVDYLAKKQKPEIISLLRELDFLSDEAFMKAARKLSASVIEHFAGLKKGQLVDLILNSGANLKGKVPREILSTGSDKSWRETYVERQEQRQAEKEQAEDNDPNDEEEDLPCARELTEDGWICLNDHTACIHNDGQNACDHEGDSTEPLYEEEAV